MPLCEGLYWIPKKVCRESRGKELINDASKSMQVYSSWKRLLQQCMQQVIGQTIVQPTAIQMDCAKVICRSNGGFKPANEIVNPQRTTTDSRRAVRGKQSVHESKRHRHIRTQRCVPDARHMPPARHSSHANRAAYCQHLLARDSTLGTIFSPHFQQLETRAAADRGSDGMGGGGPTWRGARGLVGHLPQSLRREAQMLRCGGYYAAGLPAANLRACVPWPCKQAASPMHS